MVVSEQLIDFLQFVIIGMFSSLIFDFFRTYRKGNKVTMKVVVLQDILYFIIVTILISLSIAYFLKTSIRLYIFIALICGVLIYLSLFSKYITILYIAIFKVIKYIYIFIKLPFDITRQVIQKNCKFIKKISKKCCKMFLHMVSLICNKLKLKRVLFCPFLKKEKQKRFYPMIRKYNSKKKKKNNVFKIICVCLVIYFVYTMCDQQIQINKYNSQIDMYKADIENKNKLVDYYSTQKSNVNSTEYIESVARDTLGYVKPYEKIFIDANK